MFFKLIRHNSTNSYTCSETHRSSEYETYRTWPNKTTKPGSKGVWLCMKYEIPEMIRSGGGAIVNTSSGAGVIGIPQQPVYSASKHAVLGMTKSAALEYAKSGIRINAIAPGLVETEMLERVAEDNKQLIESLKSKTPIGRIGDPQEIANAVVWLLSDKASFVLGHTLLVDGGIVSR
ncbi:MAG: SDR family oxidoreductase [Candidatus Nitrosopolaris sp.]